MESDVTMRGHIDHHTTGDELHRYLAEAFPYTGRRIPDDFHKIASLVRVSGPKRPDWQIAVFATFKTLAEPATRAGRLKRAVKIAVEGGVKIPPATATAILSSPESPVGPELQKLHTRMNEADKEGPYDRYGLDVFKFTIRYGRHDVAVAIFESANKAKRKRLIAAVHEMEREKRGE
jgi:hypothetical protein